MSFPLLLEAKPSECVTMCGMRARYESLEDCEDLRRTESRTLAKYDKRVKWFSWNAGCLALRGWRVERHEFLSTDLKCPGLGWSVGTTEHSLCVVGWTDVDNRKVEVMPIVSWSASSLPHEMGHVMLGLGHCGWKNRGVKRALEDVTGETDESVDDCN
jgi:hypothetical protein